MGRGGLAKIGAEDAVVFENDGTFGTGDFDAAGIARIGGGGGVEDAESAG